MLTQQNSEKEGSMELINEDEWLNFDLVEVRVLSAICLDRWASLNQLLRGNEFVQRLTDFNKYASASFHTALKQMDKFGSVIRRMNRKQQLVDLERVAQDEYLDII